VPLIGALLNSGESLLDSDMAKICLLTPTQPSLNPRIVKEADALAEAGHEVHVLCGHTVAWADESDILLLRKRNWRCSYVGGLPGSARHWWTRARHGAVRRFPLTWKVSSQVACCAFARITPELRAAALKVDSDLYIAHYAGALAAAGAVARRRGALLAFDAEDFESGYYEYKSGPRRIDQLTQDIERQYLPDCCYVTAASAGIGAAYAAKYGIVKPATVLNVFPRSERPLAFRETDAKAPLKLHWFSQTIGGDRGLEDVIGAMAMLRDARIELHLRGRCASGYQQQLLRLAKERGVDPATIKFFPPAVSEEMIRVSAKYDVGLALEPPTTANRELCVANKVFSYLLAGNAVAATSTAGQAAIIERLGAGGFLYQSGDCEALARGLRVWHDDRSQLDRARRSAWSLGTSTFNWDMEKKKLVEVVDSVLNAQESGVAARSGAVG
jgi:glycosyltransferase involved in cell wall biosynthesis